MLTFLQPTSMIVSLYVTLLSSNFFQQKSFPIILASCHIDVFVTFVINKKTKPNVRKRGIWIVELSHHSSRNQATTTWHSLSSKYGYHIATEMISNFDKNYCFVCLFVCLFVFFFFHSFVFCYFLSLESQILKWQNLTHQFAKMSILWNLISCMTCTFALPVINVFYTLLNISLFWHTKFYHLSNDNFTSICDCTSRG